MVFSSLVFLFYYLPVVLILYFAVPSRYRNFVLFAVSLVFYSWGEPAYLLLMLFSISCNYAFGLLIHRAANRPSSDSPSVVRFRVPSSRFWLAIACVLNLGLLAFFKYADFLVENVNLLAGTKLPLPGIPLPLGISFYTFQAMSYVIDVYRKSADVQRNFISFGAYIALFPQLIAGPIVRYSTIATELNHRRESWSLMSDGALLFCCGLAKKVVLANGAGAIYQQVSDTLFLAGGTGSVSALAAWLGILAFTFQIYFDFSGYSDMAVGLGRMFGFHFPQNFNYPYISESITEFWRRWHITLGTWFREYVYIPLGGNRCGRQRQVFNLLAVWLLTGIWHGASWNFFLWGLYFGLLLVLEKLYLSSLLKSAPRPVRHLYTMFLVVVSWVIFSAGNLSSIGVYLSAMFGSLGATDDLGWYLLQSNLPFFLLLILFSTPLPATFWRWLNAQEGQSGSTTAFLRSTMIAGILLLVTANLVSSSYNPFLYFRF